MMRWLSIAGYLGLAAAVLVVTRMVVARLGADNFVTALVVTVLAVIFSIISFRHLPIPFYIWILSVCGFRFLWSIQAPVLPDLFLDRMTMIWLVLVFMVKFVSERRPLRGPFKLELLLLAHALYILIQMILLGSKGFNSWTMSVLIPYAAFGLTKNIIFDSRHVRTLLWVLLALSIYYNVTAVAEKYDINWLVWPKYILSATTEFVGRSLGPFLQAALFGTVIGMMLPIHLYFLATVRRDWAKMLLIVSLLVGLAGLYFTYTRGSWLAGVAALATTVMLNRKAYMRYLLPAVVVAAVLAVAVLGLAQDKFMKERVENEDTIGSRIGVAVTLMRVWRDHPLFGVGYYRFASVRDQYIHAIDIPGLPTIRFNQFRSNPIHDIYLGPLAENGLVGAAFQFGIYFLILRSFLRKFSRRRYGDHFAVYALPVFGGIMVGYLIGGLAFDYRYFSVVGTLFMICAGMIDGYRPEEPLAVTPAG
ncbi:MAG: O-antigen ligase family protein [Candidatus Krumholzibacteriia bacterium]